MFALPSGSAGRPTGVVVPNQDRPALPAGTVCLRQSYGKHGGSVTLVCSIVPDIASIKVLATESPRPRLPGPVTETGSLAKAGNGFASDSDSRPGPACQRPGGRHPWRRGHDLDRFGAVSDGIGDEVAQGMFETGPVDSDQNKARSRP